MKPTYDFIRCSATVSLELTKVRGCQEMPRTIQYLIFLILNFAIFNLSFLSSGCAVVRPTHKAMKMIQTRRRVRLEGWRMTTSPTSPHISSHYSPQVSQGHTRIQGVTLHHPVHLLRAPPPAHLHLHLLPLLPSGREQGGGGGLHLLVGGGHHSGLRPLLEVRGGGGGGLGGQGVGLVAEEGDRLVRVRRRLGDRRVGRRLGRRRRRRRRSG